ncbi:hypothetical protein CNR22_20630 [Sphingobacteriaceae bacterium]|nr:hypothetical protein CNR22_20630 [Sphingobacteriaceae bacterium]
MKKIVALFCIGILCSAGLLIEANWQPLRGARVTFKIDGPFGKDVKGSLSNLKSDIEFYPDEVSRSTIKASVSSSSIFTKNRKRDSHLKSPDFFDVEKFPAISFASTSFRKVGEYFIVEGDLTIKDLTKPVTIPFEFITNQDTAWFRGDFEINRLDYDLGKKSRMMGNKVEIHLDVPVLKK